MSIAAGLQASLHNGPMTRKDGKVWEADMFLPGYQSPDAEPQWKRDRDRMLSERHRAMMGNPMAKPENQKAVVMIDDRMKRAKAARERGEPKEVIQRILTGVA